VSQTGVVVTRATAEHRELLPALFERAGTACYCRYWHFDGNANAWLDRVAHAPERNRAELVSALGAATDEASGVVALSDSRVIGWLKCAPANSLQKIYAQRIYKSLPVFGGQRDGVFAIGCFLVDPELRRSGIASALIEGAVRMARERGATAIEAFPRRAEGMRDEEMWTGPFALFERAGFRVVHDFAPYPVVRLDLGI
jgi:GNAT superfamily N-acetyltransferase